MKKLFLILLSTFAALVVGVLVSAALKPNEYRIIRTALFSHPPEQIFTYVGDLQKWELWSPWKEMDPTTQNTYPGPTTGQGATMSWTGQKSGSGSLTFTQVVPNQSIRYKLIFKDWESETEGEIVIATEAGTGKTQVSWTMFGKNTFMEKIFWVIFRMESAISKDFDRGLAKLDELLKK